MFVARAAKVAVSALPLNSLANTLSKLYPTIPKLVAPSPIIAGALGPPNDSDLEAFTNDTSGPVGPMSKFN